MNCKLCGKEKKAAKSHVIPEAFFREIRMDDKKLMLRADYPDALPKSTPIGVYDQTILCHECEAKFNRYDDYGIRVLAKEQNKFFVAAKRPNGADALQAAGVDANLLLGFLASVLWRASVSTHIFYTRVSLGPFEEILRRYIDSSEKETPNFLDAFFYKWIPPKESPFVAKTILDPAPTKLHGINLYKLYLGDFIAIIKVDSRSLPIALNEALLSKTDDFVVSLQDMHEIGDFSTIMKPAIRSQKNLEQMYRRKNK